MKRNIPYLEEISYSSFSQINDIIENQYYEWINH